MSQKKNTPGPWKILPEENENPYIRIRGGQLGRRYKIANVLTPVYDGANDIELEETRANAKLIASSPDLLDRIVKTQIGLRILLGRNRKNNDLVTDEIIKTLIELNNKEIKKAGG